MGNKLNARTVCVSYYDTGNARIGDANGNLVLSTALAGENPHGRSLQQHGFITKTEFHRAQYKTF